MGTALTTGRCARSTSAQTCASTSGTACSWVARRQSHPHIRYASHEEAQRRRNMEYDHIQEQAAHNPQPPPL